ELRLLRARFFSARSLAAARDPVPWAALLFAPPGRATHTYGRVAGREEVDAGAGLGKRLDAAAGAAGRDAHPPAAPCGVAHRGGGAASHHVVAGRRVAAPALAALGR